MRDWFSRRDLEGYMEIDHRDSPGLPGLARKWGLPIGRGQRFQAPTRTCSHCQAQIVIADRTQELHRCSKCDKNLCPRCNLEFVLTGICYPWAKRMEDVLNKAILDEINRQL